MIVSLALWRYVNCQFKCLIHLSGFCNFGFHISGFHKSGFSNFWFHISGLRNSGMCNSGFRSGVCNSEFHNSEVLLY